MLTEKDYYFIIEVSEEGYQFPYINFSLKENSFLRQLVFTKKLQTSTGVKDVLMKINKVLIGEVEKEEVWEYEAEMPCYIEIKNEISIVGDAYSQSEDLEFKLETKELLRMFEKWLEFLLKYENNEIPNLKYGFK